MIKYHVIALLCVCAAAISGIEATVQFTTTKEGYSNPLGWLMVLVCLASALLYFRVRKLRKKAGGF